MPLIQFGQVNPYYEVYERYTEASDLRITEGGDTRITTDILGNVGQASIVVVPTFIPALREPYIKVSGVWKVFVPYVKHNGVWKEPNNIYKKVSGNWKRVY